MTSLRRRGKAYGLTAVALAAALAIPGAAAAQAQEVEDDTRLNILYFNDFHGRIDNYNNLTTGFAATIEELRQVEGEENTLVLSGGDNVGGTLFNSSSQQDQPTIDVLNALEIDASVLGNHEFDAGIDDLQNRITPNTNFPYLGANVTLNGEPVADGGVAFFEVAGLDVAVIGAVTDETPALVDQNNIQGVEFTDPVEAVNREAEALKDSGVADVVIAVYHEGATVELPANAPQADQAAALESAMASQETFRSIVQDTDASVDLILNGHTHKRYTWMAPAPDGGERPIVQTGEYAANIGQIPLVIDADGNVTVDEEAFALVPTATGDDDLPVGNERVDAVAQIVEDALAVAEEIGSEPIGSLDEGADITTAFLDGARDDRTRPSAMGTFVANMYRDALAEQGGAEIGLVNPGGLRSDFIYDETTGGILTVKDAVDVLPFANSLFTTTLTGAQLKQTLEEQWQPQGSSRPFLQLGLSDNLFYTSDSSRDRNDRITGVWVDGVPIADDDEFRVAIPSFLTSGSGDNFFTLGDGTDTLDGGVIDSDAFMAYVAVQSAIAVEDGYDGIYPDYAPRQFDIVGLPTTDEVAVGDAIEFTVTQVDLTSLGTPQTESIQAGFGDDLQDFEVVDNSVEVSVTLPEFAEGETEQVLTLVLPYDIEFSYTYVLEGGSVDPDPSPSEDPTTSPTPSESPTEDPGDGGGDLPDTGGELPFVLLAFALLALVAGGAMQLRRRRS